MPVLREVITRFKFEPDKKGVDKVNRNIRNMKSGARGLARVFGVTLGAAGVFAMAKIGISMERARFNMQRFSGVTEKQVNAQLKSVKNNLDGIKKGLGAIVTDRNFFVAGSEFFKAFGKGEEQMSAFRATFEAAAKLSLATGKNVNSMFSEITQAIKSGDLGFLADFGATEVEIRNLQDMLGAIDPSAPFTSAVGMGQRMDAVLGEIQKRSGKLNTELKKIPPPVLQADKAASKMQQTMQNLSRTLTDLMIPALEKINLLLDKIVGATEKAKISGPFGALVEEPVEAAAKAIGVPQGTIDLSKRINEANKKMLMAIFNRIKKTELTPTRDSIAARVFQPNVQRVGEFGVMRRESNVTITNNFTINGVTDPEAASTIAAKKFSEIIKQAGRTLTQTEER